MENTAKTERPLNTITGHQVGTHQTQHDEKADFRSTLGNLLLFLSITYSMLTCQGRFDCLVKLERHR
jgi:hypothetical protein